VTTRDTVATVLARAALRLESAGLEQPRPDAEVLLAHALGTDRTGLVLRARQALPVDVTGRLDGLLRRRLEREPVCQIVGRREFWSLDLAVDRRVLSPRPESERLVEVVLALAPQARRILDCGTGSGALAAALARELPAARVVASDRSCDALAVAAANLARLAPLVRVVRADWVTAFRGGTFDVVVANPPYVSRGDLAGLAPEVRAWEPALALDGGPDGLDAIRTLLATAARVLAPRGWLVCEIGSGQAPAVSAAATAAAWGAPQVYRDHAGVERVLAVRRGRGGERA
jgi:release factor glutamine methyltransferase